MFSDKELFGELSTFLFAGTDTTSALLNIMVYLLVENPEKEAKVRAAIEAEIKSDSDILYANLKNIHYIDWVQKESMRMEGPVIGILVREATADHYLQNIPFTKGTSLSISGMFNQYNPNIFENPDAFIPERWEDEKNIPQYAVFGFSGGPRNCIGKHLALLESKIAQVKILRRYKSIRLPAHKRVMIRPLLYESTPTKLTFLKKEQ